jgi:hypothetical protein
VVTLCAWLRFCTFSSVGWVKCEVLLITIYAVSTVMVYMFLTYMCFPVIFFSFYFTVSCVPKHVVKDSEN